jgi:hypothetical protein
MGIHARSNGHRTGRRSLTRPSLFLLGLLVCLLFIPAATANAHVIGKYRYRYKTKLTYYRNLMDGFSDTNYVSWKHEVELLSVDITAAQKDHPEDVPMLEQSALDMRTTLQNSVVVMRDNMYADIAKFKAKAVNWFARKADKNRFKTRLATLRGGFTTFFSAYESLMAAFSDLGMNADVTACGQDVATGDITRALAETTFDKGWRQLLALQ